MTAATLPTLINDLVEAVSTAAPWVSWCGGATPAAAQVHLFSAPDDEAKPHILIDLADDLNGAREGISSAFQTTGQVLLYVCASPESTDQRTAWQAFLTRVCALVATLESHAWADGRSLEGWTKVAGPTLVNRQVGNESVTELEVVFAFRMNLLP